MKRLLGAIAVSLMLTSAGLATHTQIPVAVNTAAQNSGVASIPAQKDVSDGVDSLVKRSDKQLALQAQTDRLAAMASELKDQVDKTNKNILSIRVVRKAEEIETLAKRLKEQARR